MAGDEKSDMPAQGWRFHDREIARLDREIEALKLKHSFLEAAQVQIKEELRDDFRAVRGEFRDGLGNIVRSMEDKHEALRASVASISGNLTYWARLIVGAIVSGFLLAIVAFIVRGGLSP